MTRARPLRRAAAALALGLASAAATSPATAQSQAHKVFHPHVRAVIQAYYPMPQNPSVLDWAGRIVLWNTLQILALQGILDIGALVATCGDASDPSGLTACQDEVAALALRSQVLALEEACPVHLSAGERARCLFAFYQLLASREQVLYPRSRRFLHELSGLGYVYARHGRPDVMRFRAIPELRRLAELDTILLVVSYLRAQALAEQIALLQRIGRELAGQAWASEVPRGELFLMGPRMKLDWTRRQLEWLWTYRSYSLVSVGWAEPFREWLDLTRDGRISSAPLGLPRLGRRALLPRPPAILSASIPPGALRRPPSAPHSAEGTVRRGLYLVLAEDSEVAKDGAPILWVRGGRPIYLERRDAEQTVADSEEEPHTEGDEKDDRPPVGSEPPPGRREPSPDDSGAAATLDFLDMSYWADALADSLDRWPRQRAWPLESAEKWALGMRALGAGLDAAELAEAIARQDMVGSHVAAIAMVGGPVGALAMELTGFDAKLRRLERAGYSVPQVMDYAVEVAEDIVSPFSFGRPAPYSQMVVGHGAEEPALEAEIRNYQQRLREAIEDERRRSQPGWFTPVLRRIFERASDLIEDREEDVPGCCGIRG